MSLFRYSYVELIGGQPLSIVPILLAETSLAYPFLLLYTTSANSVDEESTLSTPDGCLPLLIESGRIMKFRVILAGLGLMLLVAACAPAPQLLNEKYLDDVSLISGDPCGAPCWRGITPGETSWQAARTIIEDDPSLSDWQQRVDDDSQRIGAAWSQTGGELCCQMFSTEDGESVEFLIMQTAPAMRLQAVIDTYGEPAYLIGETVSNDQGMFSLFYDDIPMLVYVFVAGENGTISVESEIIGFAYLTTELMTELLETSQLHAWEGLQSYRDYMNGEFELTPIASESE